MIDRILDWLAQRSPFLARVVDIVDGVAGFFSQSDAHSWVAHYLILALGTLALWPFFGFWGGAVLCFVYWGREVYQIWRRGDGFPFKWRDDLPDFFSALLGFLQVLGLLT